MKKLFISALVLIPAAAAVAQGPVDAMTLSQTELRGSARFIGMGGAFTALGADLSTLRQNPAGIGVYRGSDIGITLGLDFMSNKTAAGGYSNSETNTLFNVDNAGYVGTMTFGDNDENTISWGFSYDRIMRYNRQYTGGQASMQSSLTNYIAGITNGTAPDLLWKSDPTNGNTLYPYDNYSSNAPDWMSILFYNSGMINSETYMEDGNIYETDQYRGLWQHGGVDGAGNKIDPSSGNAIFNIRERGHVDEYNISLGGSVMNILYWGIGVGITDLDFEQDYYYSEFIDRALVPSHPAGYELGTANHSDLMAYKKVSGSGANFKIGVIVKPIQEFRIGLAVHTPTYYSLSSSSYGDTDFDFSSYETAGYRFSGSESTPWDDYDFKLNTPWKLMFGMAGVIGGRAIISADYQYDAYNDMKLKWADGDNMTYNNHNISDYYKGTSSLRLGAEFRVTPQFSLRAGYNYIASACSNEFRDANNFTEQNAANVARNISTAGQNPSYRVDDDTNNISFGFGYRSGGFYFDMAYLYSKRESTFNAFTPFVDYDNVWAAAPSWKLTDNRSHLVATLGFRF